MSCSLIMHAVKAVYNMGLFSLCFVGIWSRRYMLLHWPKVTRALREVTRWGSRVWKVCGCVSRWMGRRFMEWCYQRMYGGFCSGELSHTAV